MGFPLFWEIIFRIWFRPIYEPNPLQCPPLLHWIKQQKKKWKSLETRESGGQKEKKHHTTLFSYVQTDHLKAKSLPFFHGGKQVILIWGTSFSRLRRRIQSFKTQKNQIPKKEKQSRIEKKKGKKPQLCCQEEDIELFFSIYKYCFLWLPWFGSCKKFPWDHFIDKLWAHVMIESSSL